MTGPVAYAVSAVEGFVDEATRWRYAELARPAFERYGGRFVVSNAEPVVVEGELRVASRLSSTHRCIGYREPHWLPSPSDLWASRHRC